MSNVKDETAEAHARLYAYLRLKQLSAEATKPKPKTVKLTSFQGRTYDVPNAEEILRKARERACKKGR